MSGKLHCHHIQSPGLHLQRVFEFLKAGMQGGTLPFVMQFAGQLMGRLAELQAFLFIPLLA